MIRMDKSYEALVALIPLFEHPDGPLYTPHRTEDREDGATVYYPPIYDSDAVSKWWDALYEAPEAKDVYGTLERAHVDAERILRLGDYSSLDASTTVALMLWLTRMERFGDGVVADALDDGTILDLLKHLRDIIG